MTDIPIISIDRVSHVGSLDPASRTDRSSLEGPCLSVSVSPEDWGYIARVSGPTWDLSCEGALWFDAMSVSDQLAGQMKAWAIEQGLVTEALLWRAWYFDDESDDWAYMICDSRETALKEADQDGDPDEDVGAPTETGSSVDCQPGLRMTDAGMQHLERWADAVSGEDALLILYPMLALAPDMPELAGVWWNEHDDPLSLSCPRGGIFPDRISMFEIRDEHGNEPPFRIDLPSPGQ